MDKIEFTKGKLVMHPRNYKIRKKIRQQAKALDQFMHKCDYKNQRIWGIDACSMEIGCRPETFATEIRYLRKCSRDNMDWPWYRISETPHKGIKVTYHVGEDFLDIADGLRAVDEAVQFCCMEKGDRIGHGLVLGIDPEEYYQSKRYNIYLRKQDYLDNLVWILYRSLEFGVDIKENVRADMSEKANRMLYEIFGERISTLKTGKPLELYYRSWKLRGDHPDLYREGKFIREGKLPERHYDNCKIPGGLIKYSTRNDELRACRENSDIASLYSVYHFDNDIKNKGFQVIGFLVDKEYIDIMKSMQYAMRKEIFDKGICIDAECNMSRTA